MTASKRVGEFALQLTDLLLGADHYDASSPSQWFGGPLLPARRFFPGAHSSVFQDIP
jgi:hypothetical protein